MMPKESSYGSGCEEQLHTAERELSAFLSAVTQLFGLDQAKLAAEDWLDELALAPLPSTCRDWVAISLAASVRLASRIALVSLREI